MAFSSANLSYILPDEVVPLSDLKECFLELGIPYPEKKGTYIKKKHADLIRNSVSLDDVPLDIADDVAELLGTSGYAGSHIAIVTGTGDVGDPGEIERIYGFFKVAAPVIDGIYRAPVYIIHRNVKVAADEDMPVHAGDVAVQGTCIFPGVAKV